MRLSSLQIREIRAGVGKGGLDAALLAAQLLEMVEKLQLKLDAAEALLDGARRDLVAAAATEAEQRLVEAEASGSACAVCHDAHARAIIERLRAAAGA